MYLVYEYKNRFSDELFMIIFPESTRFVLLPAFKAFSHEVYVQSLKSVMRLIAFGSKLELTNQLVIGFKPVEGNV
jgi:S-adenosylmethionine:tRNA-ribosyltransferase-isomerase (queuine synthetase)